MLVVYATTGGGTPVYAVQYHIEEHGDGFRWNKVTAGVERGSALVFPFPLMLRNTVLTEGQAEAITGLHCPAAWDRLREMVQDSGTYRVPPVGGG